MARWFAAEQPVDALVIDDTGFPEDGDASPCATRQYSGTLGKTANCQIGVSAHLVNEHASCAADWRLFCPASWDDKAAEDPVPATATTPRSGWSWSSGMAVRGRGRGHHQRVRGRCGAGDARPLRRPGPPTGTSPAGKTAACQNAGCWPNGTRRGRARRLLAAGPARRHPTSELVRLAKIRWRIEHHYRELTTGLGLDPFEGRSFTGWHRHATLAVLAQAYQILRELQLALILGACLLCRQPVTSDSLTAALTPNLTRYYLVQSRKYYSRC